MNAFTMIKTGTMALVIGATLVVVGTADAGNDKMMVIEKPAEPATSAVVALPADHAALARYYSERASTARAEVDKHQTMKASYLSHNPTASSAMNHHCDGLIKGFEREAESFAALSAAHAAAAR